MSFFGDIFNAIKKGISEFYSDLSDIVTHVINLELDQAIGDLFTEIVYKDIFVFSLELGLSVIGITDTWVAKNFVKSSMFSNDVNLPKQTYLLMITTSINNNIPVKDVQLQTLKNGKFILNNIYNLALTDGFSQKVTLSSAIKIDVNLDIALQNLRLPDFFYETDSSGNPIILTSQSDFFVLDGETLTPGEEAAKKRIRQDITIMSLGYNHITNHFDGSGYIPAGRFYKYTEDYELVADEYRPYETIATVTQNEIEIVKRERYLVAVVSKDESTDTITVDSYNSIVIKQYADNIFVTQDLRYEMKFTTLVEDVAKGSIAPGEYINDIVLLGKTPNVLVAHGVQREFKTTTIESVLSDGNSIVKELTFYRYYFILEPYGFSDVDFYTFITELYDRGTLYQIYTEYPSFYKETYLGNTEFYVNEFVYETSSPVTTGTVSVGTAEMFSINIDSGSPTVTRVNEEDSYRNVMLPYIINGYNSNYGIGSMAVYVNLRTTTFKDIAVIDENTGFFPNIYLRSNNKNITYTDNPLEYSMLDRVCKMTNIDKEDLFDSVQQVLSQNTENVIYEIKHAFVNFGIPSVSLTGKENEIVAKALFYLFDTINAEGYSYSFDRIPASGGVTNVILTLRDSNILTTYTWIYVEPVISGVKFYEMPSDVDYYYEINNLDLTIYHKENDSSYKKTVISHIIKNDNIFYTDSGSKYLDFSITTLSDSNFFFPLSTWLYDSMNPYESLFLYNISLRYSTFATQSTYLEFWQTSSFSGLVEIVGIVLTVAMFIPTGGTSLTFSSIFINVTKSLIAALLSIVLKYAIVFICNNIGGKFLKYVSIALASASYIVANFYIFGISEQSGVKLAFSALSLTAKTGNEAFGIMIAEDSKILAKEIKEFESEYKELKNLIDSATDPFYELKKEIVIEDIVSDNAIFSPYILGAESFYYIAKGGLSYDYSLAKTGMYDMLYSYDSMDKIGIV